MRLTCADGRLMYIPVNAYYSMAENINVNNSKVKMEEDTIMGGMDTYPGKSSITLIIRLFIRLLIHHSR